MICPKCTGTIPDVSRYCLHCGFFLSPNEPHEENEQIDWENRILCSDGTCTGTVVEGRCTVCGKPFTEQ
jgi:hypothetical protein